MNYVLRFLFVPLIGFSAIMLLLAAPIAAQGCDIWKAIRDAEPSKVQACIDSKVDLDARDAKGRTPLLAVVAADGGLVVPERQKKILAALMTAGANVNATDFKGYTALHYAAFEGGFDLLTLLLNANANADAENEAGQTPLLLAARGPLMDEGRIQTISILLDAGVNVRQMDSVGCTAVHLLCAHKNRLESNNNADAIILQIIQLLHAKSADIKSADVGGNSPFSNALKEGHLQTATWLLDKGATPLATVFSSYSALHRATEQNSLPMVDRILKAGIDINRTTLEKRQADDRAFFFPKGSTPLDVALISEHEAKDPDQKKEWKSLANSLIQRGGISKTYEEYVKGFKVLKGDSKPTSSKIR